MSSYTGLYVQRTGSGKIHSVQVVDTAGMELPLDPEQYVGGDVKPPMEELLDIDLYVAAKRGTSHVLITLVRWIRGQKVTINQTETLQRFG
ncbi:hypothetical protein [Roseateles sp. LYH14W]|uniref:Uncharacterized protein n=1 Tax=Pelomonas parva TaxID=3299032 RepID=A0ABW7EZW1_9BURK